MKIFIQIASYRDKELLPTIEHCLQTAKFPENLTFGICWQKDLEDSSINKFLNDERFSIASIPFNKSKGTCWARHITNCMYRDEDFTFQIDSHSRFVKNWDEKLINLWHSLNDKKAVITAYPPQYEPGQVESEWKTDPQICNVYNFKDGLTEQKPIGFPKDINRPYRAVHVAAGFLFGPGSIIQDVPYDPEFYFLGEETALAVRLFTHGYNLYHPHLVIIHHYYERKNQPKHWVDDKNWSKYGTLARERIDCLLNRSDKHDLGSYKLGNTRTLENFKNYSGIDYERKIIHLDTVNGKEPPVDNEDRYKWSYIEKEFNKIIKWNYNKVDKCDDPRFWALIVKDQNGQELYREDILYSNNKDIIDGVIDQKLINFKYYYPSQTPTTFIIWPYSESKKWLTYAQWKLQ